MGNLEYVSCSKCGSTLISTSYKKMDHGGECLEKTCGGCGYWWQTPTLDQLTRDQIKKQKDAASNYFGSERAKRVLGEK
jgi:hypothetical protein